MSGAQNSRNEGKKVQKQVSILSIQERGQHRKIRLRENEATIFGRMQGDILLDDTEVSSTHCQVHYIQGVHHIFDMNSTNGTFVNGERIVKCMLSHNDEILVGTTKMIFQRVSEDQHVASPVKLVKKKIHSKEITCISDKVMDISHKQTPDLVVGVVYQDGSVDNFTFHEEEVYIGRASNFGKFYQDARMSRKHLCIKVNSDHEIFVEDYGSMNGYYINQQKVFGIHRVHREDVVVIGNTQLKLSLAG